MRQRSVSKQTVHHVLSFVMSFVMVLSSVFGSGVPVQAATSTLHSLSNKVDNDVDKVPNGEDYKGVYFLSDVSKMNAC